MLINMQLYDTKHCIYIANVCEGDGPVETSLDMRGSRGSGGGLDPS